MACCVWWYVRHAVVIQDYVGTLVYTAADLVLSHVSINSDCNFIRMALSVAAGL